ncbi:hypothetical protein HMP0721_2456 [Pseudoramibacter alactolyticus ATCC 23263]|uniref:Uncharacterized protein n=1 Tax=Pseudoramibacter alactolyticus ATCC 23263 TaxID=887929 RepID=E6MKC0_9FIRM|nr:hypothetical protein HMP0721_2456 [Pseudoramibacter alactolyticus ATCC 23263]
MTLTILFYHACPFIDSRNFCRIFHYFLFYFCIDYILKSFYNKINETS